jgi:hypothetical protein
MRDAHARALIRRAGELVLFALVPLWYLASMYHGNFRHGFADLHVFWTAANSVLAGHSPYPSVHQVSLGTENSFVYPAPMAFVLAPLGALPFQVAAALFTAIGVAAVLLVLRVLGVRDWRCYGAAFLSMTTMTALSTGTISPLLALGTAVLWRYRDRRVVAALSAGAVVVAKLFMWPVLVWLVATRRSRTAVLAAAGSLVVTFVAWAGLGFAGMRAYPRLLDALTTTEAHRSYSLFGIIVSGFSTPVARVATAAVGLLLVALIVVVARRNEQQGFIVAVATALLLSPIVWGHYFVLLLAPIALARPRLAPLWFAPLAFWLLLYTAHNEGELGRASLALAVATGIAGASLLRPRPLGDPVPRAPSLRVGTAA